MSESKTRRSEPPRQLERSEEYAAKRKAVTGSRLRALEQAESEIADDPDHMFWRSRTLDGARLEFFAADTGLLVKFRAPPAGPVLLEDLVDRAQPN